MTTATDIWTDAEVISCYTRQQGIEDGYLIDVTETARQARFRVQVAITSDLWAMIEDIPQNTGQDVNGRLWDVLTMARHAVNRCPSGRDRVDFDLILYHYEDRPRGANGAMMKTRIKMATLRMIIGPGDRGEPVITIGLQNDLGW
jgi:hypothetical protein